MANISSCWSCRWLSQTFDTKIKHFALNKAIEGMGGPYISVKPMNNGKELLVHFGKKIYSDKLLYRTKELNDIPVKVTPNRTLNHSRCVIWCKELANMDEENILKELKSQGVTKVKRMKRRKDGRLIPADSYMLTINNQEIPKEIKIGFLIRGIKLYIPNPQRCFYCQRDGHNKKLCKMNKNVQNADRQVMRIKIATMK